METLPKLVSRLLLLALVPALLLACLPAQADTPSFEGTLLKGNTPAADFRLTNQFGESVSLQDFAGRVVLLTFLYTNCPDVCPIAANHLRNVSELLADDAPQTAIVVVSVDPEGDSVESVLAYSERWQMTENWSYLVGSEDVLRPVWEAYYIDPYLYGPGRDAETVSGSAAERPASKGGRSALAAESRRIIHSAPIYIIDAEGIMRVAFTLPFESEDLAHDVRLLSE